MMLRFVITFVLVDVPICVGTAFHVVLRKKVGIFQEETQSQRLFLNFDTFCFVLAIWRNSVFTVFRATSKLNIFAYWAKRFRAKRKAAIQNSAIFTFRNWSQRWSFFVVFSSEKPNVTKNQARLCPCPWYLCFPQELFVKAYVLFFCHEAYQMISFTLFHIKTRVFSCYSRYVGQCKLFCLSEKNEKIHYFQLITAYYGVHCLYSLLAHAFSQKIHVLYHKTGWKHNPFSIMEYLQL